MVNIHEGLPFASLNKTSLNEIVKRGEREMKLILSFSLLNQLMMMIKEAHTAIQLEYQMIKLFIELGGGAVVHYNFIQA